MADVCKPGVRMMVWNKTSEVYREWEVHRIRRRFAWQFCMAVLQHIVDQAIPLKTAEVWRAA